VVSNGLCSPSCNSKRGTNILEQSGATININGTPIKNPSLGSIVVDSMDAVIQATKIGRVIIEGN